MVTRTSSEKVANRERGFRGVFISDRNSSRIVRLSGGFSPVFDSRLILSDQGRDILSRCREKSPFHSGRFRGAIRLHEIRIEGEVRDFERGDSKDGRLYIRKWH